MNIYITSKAFLTMKYFIEESEGEITGLGKVKLVMRESEEKVDDIYSFYRTPTPKPSLLIYDIEILPQEATGGSATLDEEALAKFLYQRIKQKKNVEDYKVWWHSHGFIQTFFSGTDTDTIDNSTEFPYLISIVGNKTGNFLTRLDIYKPLRLTIEDIELKVEPDNSKPIREECKKEIKQKVRVRKIEWPEEKDLLGFKKPYYPPEYNDPFYYEENPLFPKKYPHR